MKTRFLRIGLSFLVGALGVTTLAQGQDWLIPPASYAVQGAPFEATIDSEWEGASGSGPGHRLSREIRDSAGRQRFENPAAVTGEASQILIFDVVREQTIRLDVQRKIATITQMPRVGRTVTIDVPQRRGFPCRASMGGELIGVRWVAGLEACGQRLTQTFQRTNGRATEVRDLWLSTNYLMPLMAVRNDARLGKLTQTVVSFSPDEPDAALFEVPADYAVVKR